jgi:hypothetical protein
MLLSAIFTPQVIHGNPATANSIRELLTKHHAHIYLGGEGNAMDGYQSFTVQDGLDGLAEEGLLKKKDDGYILTPRGIQHMIQDLQRYNETMQQEEVKKEVIGAGI